MDRYEREAKEMKQEKMEGIYKRIKRRGPPKEDHRHKTGKR